MKIRQLHNLELQEELTFDDLMRDNIDTLCDWIIDNIDADNEDEIKDNFIKYGYPVDESYDYLFNNYQF